MGTYTSGRYALFKPDPTDLVDPIADMQNNLTALDTRAYRFSTYPTATSTSDNWPTSGPNAPEEGYRWLDPRSNKIKYFSQANGWSTIPSINNTNTWNNISLASGYLPNNPPDGATWRWIIPNVMAELKGYVFPTSSSGLVVAASTQFSNNGSVPGPPVAKQFEIVPSMDVNTVAVSTTSFQLLINPTGDMWYTYYGSTSNYPSNGFYLDGIRYSVT